VREREKRGKSLIAPFGRGEKGIVLGAGKGREPGEIHIRDLCMASRKESYLPGRRERTLEHAESHRRQRDYEERGTFVTEKSVSKSRRLDSLFQKGGGESTGERTRSGRERSIKGILDREKRNIN